MSSSPSWPDPGHPSSTDPGDAVADDPFDLFDPYADDDLAEAESPGSSLLEQALQNDGLLAEIDGATGRRPRRNGGRVGRDVLAEPEDAEARHKAFLRERDLARTLSAPEIDRPDDPDDPEAAWSSYFRAQHGPQPRPSWVITERAAVDHQLGVLKTGKEADVHLVRRSLPGTDRAVDLAAKRYRDTEHSQFTRDAAYLAGRRVRKSRDQRAMDKKTRTGREFLAGQWAGAEFGYLSQLYEAGVPVPYPVQLIGSELMMELILGPEGDPAPRLAQCGGDLDRATLAGLWDQLLGAVLTMAERGWAHGDLSEYNILVSGDRLVLIDVPQVIDVISNPDGVGFLTRDVAGVCRWFTRHGIDAADASLVTQEVLAAAGLA